MTSMLVLQVLSVIPVIVCFEINAYVKTECHYENYGPVFSGFYAFCRFTLLLMFIGRLYFTFNDTVFKIQKWVFVGIIVIDVLLITVFIAGTIIFAINYHQTNHVNDNNEDTDHNHGNEEEEHEHDPSVIAMAFVYYIIDVIINIVVLGMFVKRIRNVLSNLDQKMTKMETLIQKYTFLMIIAVLSTVIFVLISGVFHLTLNSDYEVSLVVYICLSMDSIINCSCVYYSMGYTKDVYNKYFKKFEIMCLNCFRSKKTTIQS